MGRHEGKPDPIAAWWRSMLRSAAPVYRRGIEEHFTQYLTRREQRTIAEGLARVVEAHESIAELTRR